MDKEEIKRLADNPKYIPGIYNYCDRWCERCPFTSRCFNFELGERHFGELENKDLDNKEFWDKLSDVFKITLELIEDEAEELGLDLSSMAQDTDEHRFKVKEQSIENNKNVEAAENYIKLVNEWFKSSDYSLAKKQEELILEDNLDLQDTSPIEDALTITDALEIIRWYQYQIYVKIKRALFSIMNEEVTEDEFQKDSDGSAKVALIGIDRSIGAWGKIYDHFRDRQDDTLDILLHLSRLRDSLETEFPDARKFKRAGFDD